MSAWLELPFELRCLVVALVGACLGSFVNWLVYTRCYFPRPISPWGPVLEGQPDRRATDRIPVFGWLGLRRESAFQQTLSRPEFLTPTAKHHWLRPMLLEVVAAIGAACLYWWEIKRVGIHIAGFPVSPTELHLEYVAHLVLFAFLLAATMIDLDEQTVPDAVSVVGTWIAVAFAIVAPLSLLPVAYRVGNGVVEETLLATPRAGWPVEWDQGLGLWIGLGCLAGWCYGIAGKTVTLRRGWVRGAKLLFASLWRHNRWAGVPLMMLVGGSTIAIVWSVGGESWKTLLTSLIGIAIGGGFIWALRVVAGSALRVEAMGFGDVTLLAMIGAFLGWQPAMLTFALAPFCAIPINLFQLIIRGENRIAFGPYLSCAAVIVVTFWVDIWAQTAIYFRFAKLMFVVLAISLIGMGMMLSIWRPIKERILKSRAQRAKQQGE